MKRTIVLLLLIIAGAVIAAAQPVRERPLLKPVLVTQTSACYADKEIDLGAEKVSPDFRGHDAQKIMNSLYARQRLVKDEFETTKQFQERVAAEESKPVLGSLTYKSSFIFEVLADFKYDADTESMNADFDKSKPSLVARNCETGAATSLGRTYSLTFPEAFAGDDYSGFSAVSFPVKLSAARDLKPTLRYFIAGHLYQTGGKYFNTEYGTSYLNFEPKELLIIAGPTGEILNKSVVKKRVKVDVSELLSHAETKIAEGKTDEARLMLRKALTQSPMEAGAYYLLGVIHQKDGDVEQAISSFKTAVFWDQNLTAAHLGLVNTYLEMKNCEQARYYLKTAQSLEPENPRLPELVKLTGNCSPR